MDAMIAANAAATVATATKGEFCNRRAPRISASAAVTRINSGKIRGKSDAFTPFIA